MEQNVFYAWNVLEIVQRMHFKTDQGSHPAIIGSKGALFYASMSIVMLMCFIQSVLWQRFVHSVFAIMV